MKSIISLIAMGILGSSLVYGQDYKTVKIKDGVPQCKFKNFLYSIKMNGDYDDWTDGTDEVRIKVTKQGKSAFYQTKYMNIKDGNERSWRMWTKQPTAFATGDIDEYIMDFEISEQNGGGAYEVIVPSEPQSYNGNDITQSRLDKWEALRMRPTDFGARDRVYKKNNSSRWGDKTIWKSLTTIQFESWNGTDFTNDYGEEVDYGTEKWQGPEIRVVKVSNCTPAQAAIYVEARNDLREEGIENFSNYEVVFDEDQQKWTVKSGDK